jgi:5-methylthioadenosine/S-adenosylhomocysteine deaminase
MPGLVNLHTHLAMTLLRGVAEDVDLQGFLERVWAEEARVMDPAGVELGTRLGAVEALLGGTTTALDMYFHPEAAHRGAVEAGLRHVIGPVFFSFPGPDGLSWEERMDAARQWPDLLLRIGGPRVPIAFMPHAPFTVDIDDLAQIAELARETGGIVHTHTSENDRENADTVASRGMRPVACLADSGVLSLAPVLGHGVRLNAAERRFVAEAGASVAHCPGSNLKLASGAADIVGYREDGIRVGLGTDGCSSSNDLDMFAVMRLAANLARLVREDPAAISAADIVRMATLDGARAIGIGDRVGSVEVGKEADLIVIDTAVPHLTPVRDPHTAVVFAAGRSDVRHVVVAGEVVIEDRRSARLDLPALLEAANARVDS